VPGLPDSVAITLQGETVTQLTQDFPNAVDFYVAECARMGAAPLKSASGKLLLRVPPEVHGSALIAAQAAGKRLNQWATDVLREAAHA
jgi:predicted HicB family RNase H-like nuclease